MILKTIVHCFIEIYLLFYMFVHLISMLLLSFLLIKLCFLIKIYMFNLFSFGGAFSAITRTSFNTATFHSQNHKLSEFILGGYSYIGIMLVDIEQWRAEIGNFNGCLHYAIIKLEINLFNIMVKVIQVLALILAIISQYVFKINAVFHFLNIIFVFVLLCIVLKFTVTNTCLYFELNQHCHKQIPYLCCHCSQCSGLWLLFTFTLFNMEIQKVIQDQGMSKLIKTFHVATGM